MTIDVIIDLINGVGFPIVMTILLFYKMDKQDARHEKEIDKLSKSVDNNTAILEKLLQRVDE